MADRDAAFAGTVPEIYDRLLVPLIFEPYANDLARRLVNPKLEDVLELAAGTGALTRVMARTLPLIRIVATDLNQPMLDQAALRQPRGDRVVWQQVDAQTLPFADRSFDAVVCQFGVMFFPDKTSAYREALRVLRPDGRFLFNAWDRIADNEFADVVTRSLESVFPDNPPRFMARVPHGYYDVGRIREELSNAGFTRIEIDAVEHRSRAETARDVANAYCHGTPLRNEIVSRDASRLDESTLVAATALAERYGQGPIEGRIRALVVVAAR